MFAKATLRRGGSDAAGVKPQSEAGALSGHRPWNGEMRVLAAARPLGVQVSGPWLVCLHQGVETRPLLAL